MSFCTPVQWVFSIASGLKPEEGQVIFGSGKDNDAGKHPFDGNEKKEIVKQPEGEGCYLRKRKKTS